MTAGAELDVTADMGPRLKSVRLPAGPDGAVHEVRFVRFGRPGARPKVYLQAGLHADEFPGMLALRRLMEILDARAERGAIKGEIVIAAAANPIGLAQRESETVVGRMLLGTRRNFNRDVPDLAALAAPSLDGELSDDPVANVETIRAAMRDALDRLAPNDAVEAMQIALLREACDSDVALDVHADNDALLHLYATPWCWPMLADLAAEIDARAVLLCEDSGSSPFDEACTKPWRALATAFPEATIPMACASGTIELRSSNDVSEKAAHRDARALERYLMRVGAVEGEPGGLPSLLCQPTALEAMQQVRATVEGVIVYRLQLGDRVRPGDVIGEIVPPFGTPQPILAETEGVLFARHNQPWAWPGKVIAKVAGSVPLAGRSGDLLSP